MLNILIILYIIGVIVMIGFTYRALTDKSNSTSFKEKCLIVLIIAFWPLASLVAFFVDSYVIRRQKRG